MTEQEIPEWPANPFVTLYSAMEHVHATWAAMGLKPTYETKPKLGSPAYHLRAAEDAIQRSYHHFAELLPEVKQEVDPE